MQSRDLWRKFMKYIIFIGALLMAHNPAHSMEPAAQWSFLDEDPIESNEIDQILQTLDRDSIFAHETNSLNEPSFPEPVIDFDADADFSLPLEDLSGIENIKPTSVPNSPVKQTVKNKVVRQKKSSNVIPEDLPGTPFVQESPEEIKKRKRLYKELVQEQEEKRRKKIEAYEIAKNNPPKAIVQTFTEMIMRNSGEISYETRNIERQIQASQPTRPKIKSHKRSKGKWLNSGESINLADYFGKKNNKSIEQKKST